MGNVREELEFRLIHLLGLLFLEFLHLNPAAETVAAADDEESYDYSRDNDYGIDEERPPRKPRIARDVHGKAAALPLQGLPAAGSIDLEHITPGLQPLEHGSAASSVHDSPLPRAFLSDRIHPVAVDVPRRIEIVKKREGYLKFGNAPGKHDLVRKRHAAAVRAYPRNLKGRVHRLPRRSLGAVEKAYPPETSEGHAVPLRDIQTGVVVEEVKSPFGRDAAVGDGGEIPAGIADKGQKGIGRRHPDASVRVFHDVRYALSVKDYESLLLSERFPVGTQAVKPVPGRTGPDLPCESAAMQLKLPVPPHLEAG